MGKGKKKTVVVDSVLGYIESVLQEIGLQYSIQDPDKDNMVAVNVEYKGDSFQIVIPDDGPIVYFVKYWNVVNDRILMDEFQLIHIVNEVNRNKHSNVDYEYQEEESGRKLLLTAMKDFFFAIDLPSAGGYLKMILDLLNESQEYFQDLLSDYNIGFINQQRDKISPYQA